MSKPEKLKARFIKLDWIAIFELCMIFEIFDGNDVLSSFTSI